MSELIDRLRTRIIEVLELQEIAPQDIDPDEQLVGGRFDIDSIDVMELVILLEKDYQVFIDSKELGAEVLKSVRAMADFIEAKHGQA
ncbi:MAG: phosphopantetheine-binding protein [Desulfosarcinaceae bacterium]|jgi:acyl carrier protein